MYFVTFMKVELTWVVQVSMIRTLTRDMHSYDHSHKKQKDSLETRAELAVLRSYVENQAILEPILFYQASKCKQINMQGSKDCL